MRLLRVAAATTLAGGLGVFAACAPAIEYLTLGSKDAAIRICAGDFDTPMTHGEPIAFASGAVEAILLSVELIGAEGVRVVEQSATRAVVLADGTHLGVGTAPVSDGGESWAARVPLHGTLIRDDGGETWFVAVALERTGDEAGGFDAVELTYEVHGRLETARGNQSLSFPARGGRCDADTTIADAVEPPSTSRGR